MNRFVFDPHYIKRTSSRVDAWGIGFLALGVGSLQVVLDTGQRKDWFSSNYIRFFAVLCIAGLVALVIRELLAKEPVVDLRALKNRSFAAGVFLISQLGFVLYASLVLLPIYVQTLLGYPAFQAGLALSPRGIGALSTTPLAGYLTSKTDPRRLLVVGLVFASLTMFSLSHLNLNAGYWDIFWPQVFQGIALSFLFIPLMALSMSGIAKEKMGNATSIFNLMRNIGGSFGVAIMTTFLSRRSQFHQSRLAEHTTLTSPTAQRMLQSAQAYFRAKGFDQFTAYRKALGALYGMVQRQASMLSFVEAFWVMGVAFLLMLPFLLLLRYSKPAAVESASPVSEQAPEFVQPVAQPAVPESAPEEEPALVTR
jgi:DHA2 family multidrug resistance protein